MNEQAVLAVFRRAPNRPLNLRQVAAALGVQKGPDRREVEAVLERLVSRGDLKPGDRGRFLLKRMPREEAVATSSEAPIGPIQITRHGQGFVAMPDGSEIRIPKGMTGEAFWGDRVEVRWTRRKGRHVPEVARVVERLRDGYVCTLEAVRDYAFAHPSDTRIHTDFFVPARNLTGARGGQKVIIDLVEWADPTDPDDAPVGRVREILGTAGEHEVEMHAILAEYGLPYTMPAAVTAAAEAIPRAIDPAEIARRKDFREVTTLTIDPTDAKDFDDALSLRTLPGGGWEVGVHIADVTHYVVPGGIVDEEARNRATSVYLVDRTVPMLPEVLSNDLCSLRPNEDRLAFSAVFELDAEAQVQQEWFGRTVIHSDRRFTYDEAQTRIETGEGDFAEEIRVLHGLASRLRDRRFAAGGIDFNTEEVKFELDEAGKPLRVTIKQMREANKLIEDFMLLANVRVALALARPAADRMHVPGAATRTAVYRIHDRPDAEKLQALRVFVARFGLEMEKPTAANAEQALRNLLQAAAGSASENVIKTMAIRSMAKAEYSTRNIGHYGLAFPFYTHFTSPIRRYPDVMVHRLLQDLLDGRPSAEPGPLERNAAHSSIMEKRASEAERASIRYKQVEYLSTRLGETFHGVVSGAVPKGLFIEVEENKCEGFVPKDALPMDHWVFNDELLAFTGLQSGAVVGMGDRLVVRVVAADLARRQLEFDLPDGVPGRSANAGGGKRLPTDRNGKVSLPSRSPRP